MANELPEDYVKRVTTNKVQAGWQKMQEQQLTRKPILAADTAVVVGNEILGKPVDESMARSFMQRLSGTTHQVITAVTVLNGTALQCRLQWNTVTFCQLTAAEIDWYIGTGEGNDKAGGYAVQGLAAQFIENITGSYSGIMGLPLFETRQLLQGMESPNE
ncbi:Septum formation protein Maf [Methylophaga frappieri]|uniref:Nucleoside triphosphate pyrophosphatase n=2 Tax=Methylophaga frappieri (strain ATCC BAA-2434 / DSM 25690 / JAM7) TaxID=754477 RepID=I1YFS0_METFJ|nr:Septum formation protein Maf [Methylophaga frappieri]